jgi:hypothetical protein
LLLQKQCSYGTGRARPLGCFGATAAIVGCSCPAAKMGCPAAAI